MQRHRVRDKLLSQTAFVIVIVILLMLILIDISLIRIYDFMSKSFVPTHIRVVLFVIVTSFSLGLSFILLEQIRPLGDDRGRGSKLHMGWLYRITKLSQYLLGGLLLYIFLQILLVSSYSTVNLIVVISWAYTLCIVILGIFTKQMLSLLHYDRSKIILIFFIIAIGSLTANLVVTQINVSLRLLDRPPETRVFLAGSTDISKGRFDLLDEFYFVSYLISFTTAWIATAALLRHYSSKIGKLKYWLIATLPMVFFLAQFGPQYVSVLFPSIQLDPFFISTLVTVIATISKPLAGLMLGIGFWTMARLVETNRPIKKYLVITGFGFFMLFTANQALLMALVPYPPFGIVTITVIGISAYLVVVGLYTSTVSISQDTDLRRSVRTIAQSKLLDTIISAESAKEIEEKVMEIVKKQSLELEDRSGVQTSLSREEAQKYLNEVLQELKRKSSGEPA